MQSLTGAFLHWFRPILQAGPFRYIGCGTPVPDSVPAGEAGIESGNFSIATARLVKNSGPGTDQEWLKGIGLERWRKPKVGGPTDFPSPTML